MSESRHAPKNLTEWADLIDNRLGPISGANADKMAEAFRAAHSQIENLRFALRGMLEMHGKPLRDEWMNDSAFEDCKAVHMHARAALGDVL